MLLKSSTEQKKPMRTSLLFKSHVPDAVVPVIFFCLVTAMKQQFSAERRRHCAFKPGMN